MNKKIFLLVIFVFLSLLFVPSVYGFPEETRLSISNVSFSGGTREVRAVYINLDNNLININSAIAKNKIGETDTLENIALLEQNNENHVLAAINGTFFNAYTDMQPQGTIISRGRVLHFVSSGSVVAFSGDNSMRVENIKIYVSGAINGNWDYPCDWSVWGMNHMYDNPDANVLLTPDFGDSTGPHDKISVVARSGMIISMCKGEAPIYPDGFTLVFGDESFAQRFKTGQVLTYKISYEKVAGSENIPADWSEMHTATGAGPTLVKQNRIIADGALEGFTEDKINNERAQRSFIGVDSNNILVMGTVSDVTIKDLAEIVQNMGLVNAMNLDGGGSSGLYYNGQYITTPGRELSNALVITRSSSSRIRIQLNGKEVFYQADPYKSGPSSGTTMIPLRGILESLGAAVTWENETQSIVLQKGSTKISLQVGSIDVYVNDERKTLSTPVELKYNNTFVPVRFMTETLGGTVGWDEERNMVTLDFDFSGTADMYNKAYSLEQAGDLEAAKKLYISIIESDNTCSGAYLQLAKIYNNEKNKTESVLNYEKYSLLNPDDIVARHSLGWIYYELGELPKAQDIFKALINDHPDTVAYYTALANCCMHYNIRDYATAKSLLEKALDLNPTEQQKSDIQNLFDYMDSH